MSEKTSKTILELDKKLQERRKEEGKEITPYNYDTNIDKDLAVTRSLEVSQEKILDNNKTLVQHAIEANAPKDLDNLAKTNSEKEIDANEFEATSINTSAIPSQEKNNTKELGDEDEKEGNER